MIVDIVYHSIQLLITILVFAIIIQALMTWFLPRGAGRFSILLAELTDPLLRPIRNVIPPLGGFDLSPIIAIVVLQLLVERVLLSIVTSLAGL